MRFSCPSLDVVFYQVLRIGDHLCKESVCNLVTLPLKPLQNVVSVFINLRRADSVCLCSMDFHVWFTH